MSMFVIAGGIFLIFSFLEAQEEGKEFSLPRVEVMTVEEGASQRHVDFGGFVRAIDSTDTASLLSARVEEILVVPGEYVKQGQLLVRLDDSIVSLEQESARIQEKGALEDQERAKKYYDALVEEAKNVLDRAKEERDEADSGSGERAIADEGVDLAHAQLETARKNRERMMNQLKNSLEGVGNEKNLSTRYVKESVIRAPYDGKVKSVFVDEGDITTAGSPVVRVSGQEYMLEITVPSDTASELSLGQEITLFGFSDKEEFAQGILSEIESESFSQEAFSSLRIYLPKEISSYEGEYLMARIPSKEESNAFQVKRESVRTYYEDTFVFVVSEDGELEQRKVNIQEEGLENFLVEGVYAGEKLVLASGTDLREGIRVEIYE